MGTSWTPCPCKFHDSPSRGNSRRHRAVATWNVDGLSAALHLQDAAGARGKQSPFLSRCFSFARSHHRSRQIFAKSQAWTLIYGKAERGLRFAQFYGHAQQYADDAPGGGIHPHPAQPQKMGAAKRACPAPHHHSLMSWHKGDSKALGCRRAIVGMDANEQFTPSPHTTRQEQAQRHKGRAESILAWLQRQGMRLPPQDLHAHPKPFPVRHPTSTQATRQCDQYKFFFPKTSRMLGSRLGSQREESSRSVRMGVAWYLRGMGRVYGRGMRGILGVAGLRGPSVREGFARGSRGRRVVFAWNGRGMLGICGVAGLWGTSVRGGFAWGSRGRRVVFAGYGRCIWAGNAWYWQRQDRQTQPEPHTTPATTSDATGGGNRGSSRGGKPTSHKHQHQRTSCKTNAKQTKHVGGSTESSRPETW